MMCYKKMKYVYMYMYFFIIKKGIILIEFMNFIL